MGLIVYSCMGSKRNTGFEVYAGLVEATQSIARSNGLAGFYKGLNVTLIEIIPYAAIHFASYELYKTALQKTEVR